MKFFLSFLEVSLNFDEICVVIFPISSIRFWGFKRSSHFWRVVFIEVYFVTQISETQKYLDSIIICTTLSTLCTSFQIYWLQYMYLKIHEFNMKFVSKCSIKEANLLVLLCQMSFCTSAFPILFQNCMMEFAVINFTWTTISHS